jgi:hypothetical protein
MLVNFIHKFDPSPSRVYSIFAQLIRDSNNREIGNCCWWIWQKYNTHVMVKDQIYE